MSQNRFRLRFTFWLDLNKPDERELAEIISQLKGERSFVSHVREGLRLVRDLRTGHTDVLCELFPWIKSSLGTAATQEQVGGQFSRDYNPITVVDDDDGALVIAAAADDGSSVGNFLDSVFGLG